MTAAALVCLGLVTGCVRTTTGTVAQTTEPGPPLTTSRPTPTALPELPIPFPLPTRRTDLPEVPAPPNALTMKCSAFLDLDEATQLAVIRAILAAQDNPLGPDGEVVGQLMVDPLCQFLPDATVNEVLLGGSPP